MYEAEKAQYLNSHGFRALSLKAVLFDMDGVLFDSMPRHADAWVKACDLFGMHVAPEEVFFNEGRTGDDTIEIFAQKHLFRPATAQEKHDIYAEKCQIFNANYKSETPRMPGAYKLLQKVRDTQLKIGVVTGSGQASLLTRLDHAYHDLINPALVVSCHDTLRGKPAPDPYLKGLDKVGAEPWEAVVVENAPLGVQAAAAAEIFTIGVNTGPLPPQALSEAGANLVFPSMQSLAEAWPLF